MENYKPYVHGMHSTQASAVKNSGHAAEVRFNSLFGEKSTRDMNFSGAGEDCEVKKEVYKKLLNEKLGVNSFTVSLKAGKNWQFHLGRLDDLSDIDFYKASLTTKLVGSKYATCGTHHLPWDRQLSILKSRPFWDNYLRKGDLLVYEYQGDYYFFNMSHVIDFIINNFNWRLLETGRIKGDVIDLKGKTHKGRITFEFRDESHKNCFVLGAHGGGSGHKLFLIMKEFVNCVKLNPLKS